VVFNKYGKGNHKVEILEFVDTREELKKREEEVINLNEIGKVDCMNLCVGGQGGFISLDGAKKGQEVTVSILKEKHGANFRKILCDIFHKTMSSDEKKEWIEKIKVGQVECDHITFKDKVHSVETKKKMSAKAKLRTGDKNSQYGSCWITNGTESKKIMKGDDIPDGWSLGRKIK